MATSKNPTSKPFSSTLTTTNNKPMTNQSKIKNLESFTCLWLDREVNSTDDNRHTQKQLRQVINHLRIFDNCDQCEQYIQQTIKEKVVLIVSGSFGRQIVPRLHSLPQFSACYVFCRDKEANKQWANKYHKVKDVFVELSHLVTAVAQDQPTLSKIEERSLISVVSHSSKSLQARNATYMWFQLFIEVLLRMHHKSADRKELINICKKNYTGNNEGMRIIDEFEKNYKSDNAIWWYTREACFYRMMNKALRVLDYDMLFALRFFITDIAKQLKIEHETFIRTSDTRIIIRVYRGQAIGIDELELMKNGVGEFLSMNSFLSTSRHRSTAIDFTRLVSITDNHQAILFEIEIDPRSKTKAFADIKKMSYYEKEGEVLIMLGALFRIENIVEDTKNRMWLSRMTLASEDDYQLNKTFAYMREKIDDATNLGSLGKILMEMGENEQAQKFYVRMLEEHELGIGDAQLGAGWVHRRCKEYDQSLQCLKKALEIHQRILGERHEKVAESYRHIGCVYHGQGNYNEALLYLNKAVKILEKTSTIDPISIAGTFNTIAVTYEHMCKTQLALEYYKKTLELQQTALPAEHPDIALTYNNMGVLYHKIDEPTEALKYYEKSLHISRTTLPPGHRDITNTEGNITKFKMKLKK